ncbi:NUDIX hydrolase N-terminal domain-containing protein [Vallitalea okinawensis]|uniref:NUDIX hydrolase N-terminal domain-containing protein n=1 Tax=Vallitalea okinawensis TaxID=2078660 RepID=UPI000CFE1D25|nr:NUDIX hydrolase [Vallitalea okinawensis]
MEEKWLRWAKQLQAIAQAGLEYSKDKYDIDRFQQIRELSIEIMSDYTGIDHSKVKSLFANEEGYQTPKVDIRAAIFKEEKILLVREQIDNRWSLPGGWADIGLTVSENIMKESMEEAGAQVKPRRVIAVLDRNTHIKDASPYSIYKVFVECDYLGGEYQDNIETIEAEFFDLENLPKLSVGRNTKSQIEMCFKARKSEVFETIFD